MPVIEVSRCPLNMRRGPSPSPRRIPTAFARLGPTSCKVTSKPAGVTVARSRHRCQRVGMRMMVQSANGCWMDAEDGARSFAYFVRPGSDQPSAGVLVFHEAFGLGVGVGGAVGDVARRGLIRR